LPSSLILFTWLLAAAALAPASVLALRARRSDLAIGGPEFVAAAIFGATAGAVHGWRSLHAADEVLIFWFAGSLTAAVAAAIDLRKRIIPNEVLSVGVALWVVGVVVWGVGPGDMLAGVASGLVVGAALLVVSSVGSGGFGMGDVKLLALLACFGGVVGLDVVVATVLISCATGGASGVLLVIVQRMRMKESYPFGPFILCGWLLTILLSSEQLLNAGFVS